LEPVLRGEYRCLVPFDVVDDIDVLVEEDEEEEEAFAIWSRVLKTSCG